MALVGATLLIFRHASPCLASDPDFSTRFRPGHRYSEPDLEAQLYRIIPRGTDLPTVLTRLEVILRKRRLTPRVIHRDERPTKPGYILVMDFPLSRRLPRWRRQLDVKPGARSYKEIFVDLGDFPYALGLIRPGAAATLTLDTNQRLLEIKTHVSQGVP